MRALLLAAGYGTRLRPLTYDTPKCLVTIQGKSLLEIWLNNLMNAEIESVLINTHHLAFRVEKFINSKYSTKYIDLVYEDELLGTAGTLIANREYFNEGECMLIHADNYCLASLLDFKKAHLNRPPECLMTMMTFRTNNPSSCGIVSLDERGVVVRFNEKPKNPESNLANGAVYILSAELMLRFNSDLSTAKDFSIDVIGKLIGKIYTFENKNIHIDIGTPEALLAAQLSLLIKQNNE